MKVTKSTGEVEDYKKDKLCQSLEAAGAPGDLVVNVCSTVEKEMKPGMSTKDIAREAYTYLVKNNTSVAARYNIRQGIADLGPAGFIFEQYVERLLSALGYETSRNQYMEGECLRHEIDVLGKTKNEHAIVEVKYHNDKSIKTHVDVVMYADARLQDIERRQSKVEKTEVPHVMWVVTNTRFTGSAIKYAKCRGLHLIGWDYPNQGRDGKSGSLQNLVQEHVLYPVTVLPSVDRQARERLADHDLMMVQDVATHTGAELAERTGIGERTTRKIVAEAHALVYGN